MMTLVTGASKGIGLALAHEFAQNGHDLFLIARDGEKLKEISTELIIQYKVKVDFKAYDLSKPGSALELYTLLKERGVQINCLVNNAGIGYMGAFAEMSVSQLDELMYINIISLSELTRCFLEDFKIRKEGRILQVASIAAFQPGPLMAAYYASKAYVTSFSHAIAYELRKTNISISILCPGATKTHFFVTAGMENSFLEKGYIGMMSAEKVAQIAYKGLQKRKLYIIPGMINKFMAYAAAMSPKSISAAVAAHFHHKSNQ